MDVPDLTRVVEAHVAVASLEPPQYYDQLRREVSPYLRRLRASGELRWFSFLLHGPQQLTPPQPGAEPIIHLRLGPAANLDIPEFVELLPSHFLDAHPVPPLGAISGLDVSALASGDWALAWKVFGEASNWLLELLDAYESGPSSPEVLQYLHFMTNPLLLGLQSVHLPTQRRF